MSSLYDGTRTFEAAKDGNILAASYDALQDQLIAGFAERTQTVSVFHGAPDEGGGATTWFFQAPLTSNVYYWSEGGFAGAHIDFPLVQLRRAELITSISIYLNAIRTGAAADQGEIALYRKEHDSTAAVLVQDLGGADPWNQAGLATISAAGLSIDIKANQSYFLKFKQHNSGAGTASIYGIWYTSLFQRGV